MLQAGWYTPSVSVTKARAMRPATETNISPLMEQDSWGSQPATGATISGPMGGYWVMSSPSAIRVTAPGRMMLDFTFFGAPSMAMMLFNPIVPAFDTP